MIDGELLGQANLLRKLATVAGRAQKRIDARARALADEMAGQMRARAPRRTGGLVGSIRVEPEGDGVVAIKAGGTPETSRPSSTHHDIFDVAVLVNYGTVNIPADPFFTSVVNEYESRIAAEFGAEVEGVMTETGED